MEKKIIDILNKVLENDEHNSLSLTENTDIINEVGLDSLGMIDFMLKLEENFDIEFDFNHFDITYFSSVKNLASYIKSLKMYF